MAARFVSRGLRPVPGALRAYAAALTMPGRARISAFEPKRTLGALFNHFICSGKQRRRDHQAEALGGLEVDDQLVLVGAAPVIGRLAPRRMRRRKSPLRHCLASDESMKSTPPVAKY